jgi:hypothetical protein
MTNNIKDTYKTWINSEIQITNWMSSKRIQINRWKKEYNTGYERGIQ